MKIGKVPFGVTSGGEAVDAITISDGAMSATILTLGATLQDLRLAGVPWPLTLGSTQVSAYEGPMRFFGAIVGPVANRIGGAAAAVDGRTCRFDANENGKTTLHGGSRGTWSKVWQVAEISAAGVTLALDLADGEGGFPGNRTVRAEFSIVPANTLRLRLTATTDRATLMNLANHSYWNLDGTPDTSGQKLTIHAAEYTPVDGDLIPTGEVRAVAGSAFDLRDGRMLGAATSLDHNFCLGRDAGRLRKIVRLEGARGVSLDIASNAVGVQVYTGDRMDTRPAPGLTGAPYGILAGVAIEPQIWPDAPNRPEFPSVALAAGESFQQQVEWKFDRKD